MMQGDSTIETTWQRASEKRSALNVGVSTRGLVDKASAVIRFRVVDYKIRRTSSEFSACDPPRASVTYLLSFLFEHFIVKTSQDNRCVV